MTTPGKCPHCGGSRVQHSGVYWCGSSKDGQSTFCLERAARQKAEAELDETLHRIKERGEEIERLRGEKCAAQGEAERERLARIKMHDEMERQACLATELRTELAETRRKLEEVEKRWACLFTWFGHMSDGSGCHVHSSECLKKMRQISESEKGGGV